MSEQPEWMMALKAECNARSQAKVARELGYQASTISQVLSGKYAADTKGIEQAVRGRYLAEMVTCPVLGALRRDHCNGHQKRKAVPTNRLRLRLAQACKTCSHASRNEPPTTLKEGEFHA